MAWLVGLGGKSEPETLYQVRATAVTSSDNATHALEKTITAIF